ncbi:outer membrane protein assembly factor BamD, partial [Umezakia ovalisporum]|uniref:outer membrane protein assembly factor BamD n=1 Tax=Umezakia ovalisporum TaxID=75695 RepID=UPI0039C64383
MRLFYGIFIGIMVFAFSSCSEFSRLQKSTDTQEKFAGAQKYYDKKDFYRSSVLLDEVIPVLRGTDQAEKAHYLFAWCHYKMRMLSLSSYYFKHFTETFPRSVFAEEANYMYCLSL